MAPRYKHSGMTALPYLKPYMQAAVRVLVTTTAMTLE